MNGWGPELTEDDDAYDAWLQVIHVPRECWDWDYFDEVAQREEDDEVSGST